MKTGRMYVGRTYVERSGQSRDLIYRRVTLDSYNMGTDKPVALKQRTILSKLNKILDAQITKFSYPPYAAHASSVRAPLLLSMPLQEVIWDFFKIKQAL